MCIAALPLIATAASTAISAYGSIAAGNAAAAAAKYDSKVANMNAAMLNDSIMDQRQQALNENRKLGEEVAAHIGAQTVGAAAGNLDVGFGSPLRALIASADAAGRDAENIMDNSARTSRDLRQQQANYRSEANMKKAQAPGLRRAGYLQAAGTVLGGIGKWQETKARLG